MKIVIFLVLIVVVLGLLAALPAINIDIVCLQKPISRAIQVLDFPARRYASS